MSFTIGSLFDGSGGFPLAASMCGGTPKWASEIEPYPIAVTKSRFPDVKHLGSVTDINGGEVEPVDVITFGSPCQDLSVAGKRAGLKHEANGDDETTRSGLFMEAVRIIKEMREATNGVYPRFAVWENVPGAFSSNKGEDFRIVIQELIQVVEPTAVMPEVPKNGWPYADSYCGDGWSIAYRVLDAQFWGVPQRRRRIYLVADFRGECAGKVSFERESLRGYFETGRTPWQTAAGDAESGSGTADCKGIGLDIYNSSVTGDVAASLTTATDLGASNTGPSVIAIDQQGGKGGNNVPAVVEGKPVYCLQGGGATSQNSQGMGYKTSTSYTLNTTDLHAVAFQTYQKVTGPLMANSHPGSYTGQDAFSDMLVAGPNVQYVDTTHADDVVRVDDVTAPLQERDYKGGKLVTYGVDCRNATEYPELTGALQADSAHNLNSNNVVRIQYIVRRLTPTECARLQGFPDAWGHPVEKTELTDEEYQFWMNVRNTHAAINDKATKEYTKEQMLKWYNSLHTDSSEYKMWGNGIALPNALYVMQGIADVMSEEKEARRKWLKNLLGDCL